MLRHRNTWLIAVVGALFVALDASAEFIGVTFEVHTTVSTPSGLRKVYRMYAVFTNPGDRLVSWGSANGTSVTTIRTYCQSNFYNAPNGSTAPSQKTIDAIPHAQWDTFATIGVSIAEQGSGIAPAGPDMTTLSIGFSNFAPGNIWTTTSAAVYVGGPGPGTEQALAGYAGDGDVQLRVLMAQLSVMPDEGLSVRIGTVQWQNEGSTSTQTETDLWLDPLDAQGRCCSPNGTCGFTTLGGCLQYGPNQWLGCSPCTECQPFTPCWADVANQDNNVDIDDLLAVINAWGVAGFHHPADANYSFAVNIDDLLLVINSWGPCP